MDVPRCSLSIVPTREMYLTSDLIGPSAMGTIDGEIARIRVLSDLWNVEDRLNRILNGMLRVISESSSCIYCYHERLEG